MCRENFIFVLKLITYSYIHLEFQCNTLTIILVSAPTSSFTLAVSMREVYCVGCTPRAYSFLQSILDVPLKPRI